MATADHRDMTVPPLCVVPAHLRTADALEALVRCLVSLWGTAGGPPALVVAYGVPKLLEMAAAATAELGCELHVQPRPESFSRTVNVGLRRALADGRDALLVAPELELLAAGWLERMLARTDGAGRPAAVVGARLLYPNRCIEHAGLYFSPLEHAWRRRCLYAPGDLPEALRPLQCPVGAALALVRHATLAQVGLYDEELTAGGEDVDYCLRSFAAGLECVYEPAAVALRHLRLDAEPAGDEPSRRRSAARLVRKWRTADLSPFVPELV